MALKVAINGYGTIGKRVADAVMQLPCRTIWRSSV
jgi:glyceraldehyde-3-phosphate dehydrogenase/erythrose-4-phosphate dehydrogenase